MIIRVGFDHDQGLNELLKQSGSSNNNNNNNRKAGNLHERKSLVLTDKHSDFTGTASST